MPRISNLLQRLALYLSEHTALGTLDLDANHAPLHTSVTVDATLAKASLHRPELIGPDGLQSFLNLDLDRTLGCHDATTRRAGTVSKSWSCPTGPLNS